MRDRRGVTLVEMLVAFFILGIASYAMVQMFVTGNSAAAYLTNTSDLVENGNGGLLDFPRLNGFVHMTRGASSVVKIDAPTLTVQVSDTQYKIYSSGTDLLLENLSTGAKTTIAKHVKSAAFKYFGLNASSQFVQTTDTTIVKTVSMDIQLESADKKRTLFLSTAVTMRNKN